MKFKSITYKWVFNFIGLITLILVIIDLIIYVAINQYFNNYAHLFKRALLDSDTGKVTYGVGVSSNITRASVRAVFSGINRLGLGERQQGIADHY